MKKYKELISSINEVPLLGKKESFYSDSSVRQLFLETNVAAKGQSLEDKSLINANVYAIKRCLKTFEKVENTGTNISYRCMKCRNCLECKNGGTIDEISIQEEIEQELIDKSVTVDVVQRVCIAKLPFIADPDSRLVPNLNIARKVYNSQVRRLEKSPKDLRDIIVAERKLENLGFVEYLDNLDEKDQMIIMNSMVKYFIPWRVVWIKSLSTPVRPVFDASQCTPMDVA